MVSRHLMQTNLIPKGNDLCVSFPFLPSHYNMTSEAMKIFPSFVFAFASGLCLGPYFTAYSRLRFSSKNSQTPCNLPFFFFSGNGNILKRLSCPFLCRSGFGNNRLSEISFLRNLLLRTDRAQPGGIQRRNCLQRSIYIL